MYIEKYFFQCSLLYFAMINVLYYHYFFIGICKYEYAKTVFTRCSQAKNRAFC